MSSVSSIEWTDATWNPIRGCTKISPGCAHCYAETFAERFRGVKGHPYENGFDLRLVPEKLSEPLAWNQPKKVFVNSMSDLFHKDIPELFLERVAGVMEIANWHTYQVLTKRPDRMIALLRSRLAFAALFDHVWWGVSVENRKYGLPRIDLLRTSPVSNKFLSIEPLLENLGELDLKGIKWVIVGGESGNGARRIEKDWILSIRDQCFKSNVPFFFKQWGGPRKKQSGRVIDGVSYEEVPVFSLGSVLPKTERFQIAEKIKEGARTLI